MAHRVRGVMAGSGALVMVGLLSIPSVAADKSNPSRSSTSSPSYQTKSSSSYQPKSSPPPMHQQFDKSAPKSTPSNAKTQGNDAKPVEAKLPPDLKAAIGGGKGSALSQVFNPQVRRPPAAVPQQPKKTTNSGNGGGGTSADASGGNRMPRGLTAQSKPPAPPTR
jgi:hypothetical protein